MNNSWNDDGSANRSDNSAYTHESDLTNNLAPLIDFNNLSRRSMLSDSERTLSGGELDADVQEDDAGVMRQLHETISISQPNLATTADQKTNTMRRAESSTVGEKKKKQVPEGIPVLATLQENKDLKEEIQQLTMKTWYLNSIIPYIEGKSGEQICNEYATLRRTHRELTDSHEQMEKDFVVAQKELEALRRSKDSARADQMVNSQRERIRELNDLNRELENQLEFARQRYPDFDDSIDSIFGDSRQREIGDLKEVIHGMEIEREEFMKLKELSDEAALSARERCSRLEKELNQLHEELQLNVHKARAGDETFAVGVGELDKVTYEKKVEELMRALDERDQKVRETEEDLTKAMKLMNVINKQKERVERDLASLTMSLRVDPNNVSELHQSVVEDPERRAETMREWMEKLAVLEEQNEELKHKLAGLGAAYVAARAAGGKDDLEKSLVETEEGRQLTDMLERLDQIVIPPVDYSAFDLTSFSDMSAGSRSGSRSRKRSAEQHADGSVVDQDLQASFHEMSLNASHNVDVVKEKLSHFRASYSALFDKLKGASALFGVILSHIKGDSEICNQIKELQLVFDATDSEWSKTKDAIEELETSMNEVGSFLERSLNESNFCMAAFHQSRLQGGGHNDSGSAASGSAGRVLPGSPHLVISDAARILNEERAHWTEIEKTWAVQRQQMESDRDVVVREAREAEKKVVEMTAELARVQEQLTMAHSTLREQEFACSELKMELDRMFDEEQRMKHANEEMVNSLKENHACNVEVQGELANLYEQMNTMRQINEQLKQELEATSEEAKERFHAEESTSAKCAELEHLLAETVEQKKIIEDRFVSLVERENVVRGELGECQQNAHRMEEQLRDAQTIAQKYIAEITRLEERVVKGNEDVEVYRGEAHEYQRKLENMERREEEREKRENQNPAQSRSAQTEHSGAAIAEEEIHRLTDQISLIADKTIELARLRGDYDEEKRRRENENSISSASPLTSLHSQLSFLSVSVHRACEGTRQQTDHIKQLTARMNAAVMKEEEERKVVAVEEMKQRSSPSNNEQVIDIGKTDRVTLHKMEWMGKKFEDPLRQAFFEMTTQANELVQAVKGMNGKTTKEIYETCYQNILAQSRLLRETISNRFQAVCTENKENHQMSPVELLERIAILSEDNANLTMKLAETRKKWKEAREAVGKGGHCALDSGIAEHIEKELVDIKKVLDQCTLTYRKHSSKKTTSSGTAEDVKKTSGVSTGEKRQGLSAEGKENRE